MTLISLREYGYAINDDKQHRIYCMQQCMEQNNISEFIRHCLYIGQFQEIILDDFLSLDIGLDENTKWKILKLKRKHGYHEAKKEFKQKIEDLEYKNNNLQKQIFELKEYKDELAFMEHYIDMLRNKIIKLTNEKEMDYNPRKRTFSRYNAL